jgi:mannose/cellobiose epimerase-like protein (N-acyl-D-glucosamine 2-epimerase family)
VKINFRKQKFLQDHIKEIISFYHPRCIDKDFGGYIHQFRDDGSIDDRMTKHLVGTCRFIYIYSISFITLKKPEYQEAAEQGLKFLREVHQQPDGGFAWILNGNQVKDDKRYCYGHAFVLLAAAVATKAQIKGAKEFASEVYEILEKNFWDK